MTTCEDEDTCVGAHRMRVETVVEKTRTERESRLWHMLPVIEPEVRKGRRASEQHHRLRAGLTPWEQGTGLESTASRSRKQPACVLWGTDYPRLQMNGLGSRRIQVQGQSKGRSQVT